MVNKFGLKIDDTDYPSGSSGVAIHVSSGSDSLNIECNGNTLKINYSDISPEDLQSLCETFTSALIISTAFANKSNFGKRSGRNNFGMMPGGAGNVQNAFMRFFRSFTGTGGVINALVVIMLIFANNSARWSIKNKGLQSEISNMSEQISALQAQNAALLAQNNIPVAGEMNMNHFTVYVTLPQNSTELETFGGQNITISMGDVAVDNRSILGKFMPEESESRLTRRYNQTSSVYKNEPEKIDFLLQRLGEVSMNSETVRAYNKLMELRMKYSGISDEDINKAVNAAIQAILNSFDKASKGLGQFAKSEASMASESLAGTAGDILGHLALVSKKIFDATKTENVIQTGIFLKNVTQTLLEFHTLAVAGVEESRLSCIRFTSGKKGTSEGDLFRALKLSDKLTGSTSGTQIVNAIDYACKSNDVFSTELQKINRDVLFEAPFQLMGWFYRTFSSTIVQCILSGIVAFVTAIYYRYLPNAIRRMRGFGKRTKRSMPKSKSKKSPRSRAKQISCKVINDHIRYLREL